MNGEEYILRLQKEGAHDGMGRLVLGILSGLEELYTWGVLRKYRKDTAGAVHPGVPVISAGNITAGGTGKTPCIMALAGMIQQMGKHPAVLTRGYRGGAEKTGAVVSDGKKLLLSQEQAGDEPYLLAVKLPGVPVIAGRDRLHSAKEAIALGCDVMLLDDGFQYWKMKRDLDIVLIDCTNPFGGGHILPRGLLREPLEHIRRADLLILTKCDQVEEEARQKIIDAVKSFCPNVPIVLSSHAPNALTEISLWRAGKMEKIGAAPEERVYLLSALGNPGAFRRTAEEAGLLVKGGNALPDHHVYTAEELKNTGETARKCGAESIVVTEKDAVKIKEKADTCDMPLRVLSIEMTFWGNGNEIMQQALEDIL